MKYVVIGNSAAGLSAAKEIRKQDPKGSVTIVGRENFPAYGRPMISYYLKDKITLDKLPIEKESFYKDNNIAVITGEAVNIDRAAKQVELKDGSKLPYNKLILATGSIPFVPPVKGLGGQGNVFSFLDAASAVKLKETVKPGTRVVILGGGLIALKAAEGLKGITSDITVIELADRILPTILNNAAAETVKKYIAGHDIKFYLKDTIAEVFGAEKVEKVLLSSGVELPVDVLITAVGVRPETSLAVKAGLKVNRGIAIDKNMRTSDPDIFAAGDVTEVTDMLDGRTKIIALWPNAVAGGKCAGANAAGGAESYENIFPFNAIDFFGLRMITGGIINPDASFTVKNYVKPGSYADFIIKDDMLYGYILIGDVDRAGLFTDIIRNGYPLSGFNDVFNSRTLLSYAKELREMKYKGLV